MSGFAIQGRARSNPRCSRDQVPPLSATYSIEAHEPHRERQKSSLRRRELWLFIPEMKFEESAFAQDMAGSSSVSKSPSPSIELFVTSSGKPTPRPLSWRGWKTRPWLRRLYGTICDPSTAERGAERFISSLPAIPASRSATPGSDVARPIQGTYGPKSLASSMKSDHPLSSSKTSVITLMQTFKPDDALIKKRIENLIEREYLERDKNDPSMLLYKA